MKITAPVRVARTYTQQLVGSPEVVFPLLCPVREVDWIHDWDPVFVVSRTGVAEPDCIFMTEASPGNTLWYITRHEPKNWFVEMLKITPAVTACRLSIQLRRVPEGCEAQVTYMHTSLGPDGDTFVESFTEAAYASFMQVWESRMNHYIRTGRALQAEA